MLWELVSKKLDELGMRQIDICRKAARNDKETKRLEMVLVRIKEGKLPNKKNLRQILKSMELENAEEEKIWKAHSLLERSNEKEDKRLKKEQGISYLRKKFFRSYKVDWELMQGSYSKNDLALVTKDGAKKYAKYFDLQTIQRALKGKPVLKSNEMFFIGLISLALIPKNKNVPFLMWNLTFIYLLHERKGRRGVSPKLSVGYVAHMPSDKDLSTDRQYFINALRLVCKNLKIKFPVDLKRFLSDLALQYAEKKGMERETGKISIEAKQLGEIADSLMLVLLEISSPNRSGDDVDKICDQIRREKIKLKNMSFQLENEEFMVEIAKQYFHKCLFIS